MLAYFNSIATKITCIERKHFPEVKAKPFILLLHKGAVVQLFLRTCKKMTVNLLALNLYGDLQLIATSTYMRLRRSGPFLSEACGPTDCNLFGEI